jgi:hypothetical protein
MKRNVPYASEGKGEEGEKKKEEMNNKKVKKRKSAILLTPCPSSPT